ncbi:26S proteasome subunit RPN7-domain-containing protein [Fimicolochytrium jonesii]|uniref:26S proteasome subunit RPN7-domain-containing protein n=1 Tax=Fimicolochytrium jonesii TaxID=1396493 RepID=UPI0022FF08B7|nr:26S proteasome subunit RPN7-domain-containing protein [Fimicolochytrium jonesii]KAI8825606.1 26S proteasome subunit RPN7-domain-containing protein [Fimicolochytrium jonesii]
MDLAFENHFNMASRRPNDTPGEANDEITADNSKKKKTAKVIVNDPTIDLDSYTANYSGRTKIVRLLHIAEWSPPLSIDAYKLALQELRNTLDYQLYIDVHRKLNHSLEERRQPPVALDAAWVNHAKKEFKDKSEKLEQELKGYKVNLIKESIRMGHNDLAEHLYNGGELQGALRSYSRTRDYCTTSKHVVDMCLSVAKVSLELANFSHVQNYIVKAMSHPEVQEKGIINSKLKCLSGLVDLENGQFKRAAGSFLDVSFSLGSQFSEIISPNDIALYGALCALATFDRHELKSKVFENAEYKQYLELEPQVRELLYGFYQSKYTQCLDTLTRMKSDLYLDIWLHGHVDLIYQNIRKKALVQYFQPFLSVDMHKMSRSFSTSVTELERELAMLIMGKEINGRIDSHNKILRVKAADQRSTIFEHSLAMGTDYQTQVRHLMLRMKLVRADMISTSSSPFPLSLIILKLFFYVLQLKHPMRDVMAVEEEVEGMGADTTQEGIMGAGKGDRRI